jgi:lipoate---protein ligase
VVLGRFQPVKNEVDEEAAREHGIRIVRRMTGGGAMFVETENVITYSIYAPPELVAGMSSVDSYAYLDEWVVEALRSLGIDACYEPINDITSSNGKIGGAAQARSPGAVLYHVTMSYEMDAAKMLEVLRIGQEKVSDKAIQSVEKRVGPLRRSLSRVRVQVRFVLPLSILSNPAARIAAYYGSTALTTGRERAGVDMPALSPGGR